MNISKAIIDQRLSPDGGVYRRLPLFTLSCAAYGYGRLIRQLAGITYGWVGAHGNRRGWQTMYRIRQVTRRMSRHMEHDQHWISRTRQRAHEECTSFERSLKNTSKLAASRPFSFIRFAAHAYPRYMAGIGVYNLFWRYLEYADDSQSPFPQRGLAALARERNDMAAIYPRCEALVFSAAHRIAADLTVRPDRLLMMTRSELLHTIVRQRLSVPERILNARQRGYVYLYARGSETVSIDIRERRTLSRYLRECATKVRGPIHGRSIQRGRVSGTVITHLRRKSWPRQPIYVVSNTHPSEMPMLSNVSAIVADEGGGILSHAAIVSRELGIPCVIGTKVATKVLKDGDRVEVDATKGIVRKI